MNIRQAARSLGVSPSTVLRWVGRLSLPAARLPDGRRVLAPESVRAIRDARAASSKAQDTSAGMHKYWSEKRST